MRMNVTLLLIAVNLAVFGLQTFVPGFTEMFALTPAFAVEGGYWQFISYMFLHSLYSPIHILLNMFVLGIFGMPVEHRLGWKNFLLLYFIAGLGSAFLYILITGDAMVMMLGASGAVFGVLAAYGILFPKNWIMVFFIPLPAPVAVIAITAFELVVGIFGILPGIANFGHIGGIVTGVLFVLIWLRVKRKVPVEDRLPRNYEFIWE